MSSVWEPKSASRKRKHSNKGETREEESRKRKHSRKESHSKFIDS